MSADHCRIGYSYDKGWSISEKNKDKLSSNGTFVFMKSHNQMIEHEPSDLIPVYDGMVISFINYEIRFNLEKKDTNQIQIEEQQIQRAHEHLAKTSKEFQTRVKAHAVTKFKMTKSVPVEFAVAEVANASVQPVGKPRTVVVVSRKYINYQHDVANH